MKLIALILFALLLGFSLRAEEIFIEGDIQLTYTKGLSSRNAIRKEFGHVVKATTVWHVGDFFGEQTVFAGVEVKNTGAKPMYYQYYVAFFDKNKKIVGTAGQGESDGIKPAEETQLGSCIIRLPRDKYKEIVSYQAVIYETDVDPKEKGK